MRDPAAVDEWVAGELEVRQEVHIIQHGSVAGHVVAVSVHRDDVDDAVGHREDGHRDDEDDN